MHFVHKLIDWLCGVVEMEMWCVRWEPPSAVSATKTIITRSIFNNTKNHPTWSSYGAFTHTRALRWDWMRCADNSMYFNWGVHTFCYQRSRSHPIPLCVWMHHYRHSTAVITFFLSSLISLYLTVSPKSLSIKPASFCPMQCTFSLRCTFNIVPVERCTVN